MSREPPRAERTLERAILASRWLQVPLYVGLIGVFVIFAIKFFQELYHLAATVWEAGEADMVLGVLSLVDVVMVANLVIMVIISGYENFVSRIDVDEDGDKPSGLSKLDPGSLKIKLAGSIVAISSIHLLRAFLNVEAIPNDKLMWLVVIHLTFVLSGLMLAYLDHLAFRKKS